MAKRNNSNGRSNGHPVATARRTAAARSSSPAKTDDSRLPVLKTYKLYINGQFPRTESGRFYTLHDSRGAALANVCLGSRKDFRDAVVAARNAQSGWAKRSAFNRSQILYRIAEMLEGRTAQFAQELVTFGLATSAATKEVQTTIDRALYYAGWADKYQQVFSSVNPVASSHFNFSMLEPTGVVAAIAPEKSPLLGLASVVFPAICGGNSVIALASNKGAMPAITFAEVLATSDLPGGVVNILTGTRDELVEHFASHMDVNAVVACDASPAHRKTIHEKSAANVKRATFYDNIDWLSAAGESPYFILDTQETKTTWHPVGV